MNWNQHYCLFNSQSSIRYIIQFCHTHICFFMFAKCSYLCFYFSSRWFCFRKWSMIITFSRWKIHSIFCSVIFFYLAPKESDLLFYTSAFLSVTNFSLQCNQIYQIWWLLINLWLFIFTIEFSNKFLSQFFHQVPIAEFWNFETDSHMVGMEQIWPQFPVNFDFGCLLCIYIIAGVLVMSISSHIFWLLWKHKYCLLFYCCFGKWKRKQYSLFYCYFLL